MILARREITRPIQVSPTFVSRIFIYKYGSSALHTHRSATLAISFPRKLLGRRLEKLPSSPSSVPAFAMLLALLAFLNPLSGTRLSLSLSHTLSNTGADRG